jgi:hypothetical protein
VLQRGANSGRRGPTAAMVVRLSCGSRDRLGLSYSRAVPSSLLGDRIISLSRLKAAPVALASRGALHHASGMFVITEADAAAIRAVFNEEGELSAVIELRRRFPGVTDNAKARTCARSIAGWTPLPAQLRPVTELRPRRDS